MKTSYCFFALMLTVTTLFEVYGGKFTFMCLRKSISCKRAQKLFSCEDLKKCGLEECGEADLR